MLSRASKSDHAAPLARSLFLFPLCIVPTAFVVLATPKASGLRFAWLACLVFLAHNLLRNIAAATTSVVLGNVLVGEALFVLIQCVNLLVIAPSDGQTLLQAEVFASQDGSALQILRTASVLVNLRGIGTPWEAKHVADGRGVLGGEKGVEVEAKARQTRRRQYLLRQMLITSWQYLFLDVFHQLAVESSRNHGSSLVAAGSEFVYLGSTLEQWAVRVIFTIFVGLGPGRVQIDFLYRLCSVVAVASGLCEPEHYPPLFGSVTRAYSLRRFWT